jgi:V-type H+-transporting ATPase subunit d
MRELYRLVLVDTPLAPYFSECITSEVKTLQPFVLSINVEIVKYILVESFTCIVQDLDDMNIEIMRNTLYKAYLEDFYKFCAVCTTSYDGFYNVF